MTDFALLDLDSPKPGTSRGRRSSAISSWDDEGTSEKRNVPVHLFASPAHSDSALSSSTSSSRPRERRRKKKSTQETTFSSFRTSDETKREKATKHPVKTEENEILSSPSESRGYTSSGTEDLISPAGKPKRKNEAFPKPLPPLRTNKIHDVRAQDEIRKIRIDEKNESRNRTKMTKFKKNRDEGRRSSPGNSPVERSFTPMSDNMSYREKIRDRFNTVKERAVESLSRPQSRSQSRLKLLMMKQSGTRVEDLLKKEEDEIVAAIEKHEKTKLKWKEIYKEVTEIQHASHSEGYLFFTDANEALTPILTPTVEPPVSPDGNSPLEAQSETKVLTSEYLGIKDDWDLIEFCKPEIVDERQFKIKQEELLFCPSTKSVPLENKLESGSVPINLEEGGFYVGNKTLVPKNMRNKMEQRVLMSANSRKWFGKDGELISSPCPLKLISTRLLVEDDMAQSTNEIVFKPATLSDLNHRYMDLSGDLNYVLDIDVSSIRFSHHPLFSREHLIAQSLKELYVKYKRRAEIDHLSRLCGRLDALRRARDNLKNAINENGDNENLRKQLRKYEDDIQEVRHLRNIEGRMDKELLKKILATWKDLKQLREQQGYQNTTIKMIIKKKVPDDPEAKKKKWEADIKNDVHEIQMEKEREHKKLLDEYKEKHENWSRNKKKRLRLNERVESEDSAEKLSDTESVENYDYDSDKDDELDEEPKPPGKIDAGDIKTQVIETYKNCFRQPGEPELEIALSSMVNPDVTAYNNKEEQRRSAVKKTFVFVKLFYNGKEVCRSKSQPLSQKFNVMITQRFTIRILEWPESLMIEIHEDAGPLTKTLLVSGIYLPFPDSFTTVQNSDVEEHEFSSKLSVSYNHSAVGSGYNVIPYPDGSEFNNRPVCLFTSGVIVCRVGWADDHGKILAPPEKFWNSKRDEATTNLSEIIGASGKFDITKLKDWAEKSKLDPNDPYNAAFFHFLQHASDAIKMDPCYFRLDPLLMDYNFCEENDLEENLRLKLLRLRDLGEPEFRGTKFVPLNEKQIHKDIFKIYEKRISTPYRLLDIGSSDPLDGHRAWGKKYLEQVQQRVLKQCRLARQHKRLQDIVSEETVPDIGTLGLTFMKWLQPKRPLRPVRRERKKIAVQNLSGQDVKIVVNVVRAFEVPVRKDVDTMSVNESIEGFSLVNVRPFVEISFRGIKARTTAAEGANPTWNQDLQIPFHTKNGDFSPGSLQSIRDTLYLHLFDEMVVDLIEDDSLQETNIHQRLERHWLAGMEIPFSTLCFNSRIEGTFKLYSPPVLLGYEREAHRRQFGGPSQEPLLPQRDATYITLFITVQPALHPPEPFKEKLESSEIPSLEKHLEGWQQEIASMFPYRKIKTLVTDITGKSVCVTRFIKPLAPPVIAEMEKVTPEMAARFVSMIPSIAGSTFFPGLFDIWLTSDQILRLLTGDSEDHAILLCSYFLHLGFKAYLLLGSGIPYGPTAYVLVKEGFSKSSEYFIWDATNGQRYSTNDSFCPLQKIYCLIDDQNIWANIQPEEAPRRTRFDLSKRADWFPAFGRNIAAPTGSVQPQILDYRITSKQSVEILQDKMEKRLRDNLMKWRKKNRTQWNRYCAAILRKLLPKLEEATWNAGDNHSPNHILELHHILASHKMCGFPINMPYTDMEAVTEAVKATGVHCNETEEVEFAVAVYIHPYPNDILSVWIYVASLVKRR